MVCLCADIFLLSSGTCKLAQGFRLLGTTFGRPGFESWSPRSEMFFRVKVREMSKAIIALGKLPQVGGSHLCFVLWNTLNVKTLPADRAGFDLLPLK